MIESILQGYLNLFQPVTFAFLLMGFIVGLVFGITPGLTATLAIALLLPLTFVLSTVNALVMAMGIFVAAMATGSITGILINIPGSPGGAITTIEGNILMKKGRGALALTHATFSSMIGGVAGVIILMTLCPIVAKLALLLQTPERFSLIVLAIVAVIVTGKGEVTKAIIATTIGIMIATVGIDSGTSNTRFTFNLISLSEGISLLPAMIGLFAISEILVQMEQSQQEIPSNVKELKFERKNFIPKFSDMKRLGSMIYIKSILIGVAVGVLPGIGASVASFMAYTEAKRSSKHPEEWDKGNLEGIVAPEVSTNAMCAGCMVPVLTLGIPGDPVTAMLLGMFRIQGIVPGPALFEKSMYLVATIYAALMVAALLIPISLYILGPYYMRIALVKKSILYSFIAIIAMIGPYAAAFSVFQILVALILGIGAYILRKFGYPIIPLLMGLILGPLAEDFLRRSLVLYETPMVFLTRPISLVFIIISVILIYYLGIKRKPSNS